jgi:hypothetical protein
MSYFDGSTVNITVLFQKVQTCQMLTAQPSTYDMFGLIELYGRKLHSELCYPVCSGTYKGSFPCVRLMSVEGAKYMLSFYSLDFLLDVHLLYFFINMLCFKIAHFDISQFLYNVVCCSNPVIT